MARIAHVGGVLRRERGPKPLHAQLWAERHRINIGVAQPAQQAAAFAEPLLDLLRQLQTPPVRAKLPPPPSFTEWLAFYERPLEFYVDLGNKVSRSSLGTRAVASYTALAEFIELVTKWPEETKAAFAAVDPKGFRRSFLRELRRARQDYRKHLAELRQDLEDRAAELQEDMLRSLEKSPEMQFALEVFLPCMLHFATTPAALLTRARAGDEAAIEDLIRLDPVMSTEPSIVEWTHRVPRNVRDWRSELVGRCMRDRVPRVPTARAIKESAAGLVGLIAAGGAFRLTSSGGVQRYQVRAPQILELFHAIAKDRGTANVRGEDPDLCDVSAVAWSKSVQRHRKTWMDGLGINPDKK